MSATLALLAAVTISGCIATDGDSIRCGRERIRLLAIDAPEMGRCYPVGRHCAPGDPIASPNNLRRLIDGKAVEIERVGKDRYGRTLAVARAGVVNLSYAQLGGGFAIYRWDWDNGRRVAKICRYAPAISKFATKP